MLPRNPKKVTLLFSWQGIIMKLVCLRNYICALNTQHLNGDTLNYVISEYRKKYDTLQGSSGSKVLQPWSRYAALNGSVCMVARKYHISAAQRARMVPDTRRHVLASKPINSSDLHRILSIRTVSWMSPMGLPILHRSIWILIPQPLPSHGETFSKHYK